MAFDSREIANYFIDKSMQSNSGISPMKVLKLVYIAHGWHLALTGNPLINEDISAWQYGPVISSLYDSVKRYGRHEISELITKENPLKLMLEGKKGTPIEGNFSDKDQEFLDKIWEVYNDFSAFQLSEMTHDKGTPWEQVYDPEVRGKIIPNKIIKEYYEKRIS